MCEGASQFSRGRLRDGCGRELDNATGSNVDVGENFTGHLTLDLPDLIMAFRGFGLDGEREGFVRLPGVQTHSHCTARPHACDACSGAFDVSGIDVAPPP